MSCSIRKSHRRFLCLLFHNYFVACDSIVVSSTLLDLQVFFFLLLLIIWILITAIDISFSSFIRCLVRLGLRAAGYRKYRYSKCSLQRIAQRKSISSFRLEFWSEVDQGIKLWKILDVALLIVRMKVFHKDSMYQHQRIIYLQPLAKAS